MQLRRLQQEWQRDLFAGDGAIREAIVDAPPLPVEQRLAIYRNGYQVRLIEALDETYPAIHQLLGDETFSALGEMYIAAHPSTYRSIRWYGGELGNYLALTEPFAAQPVLSEIACFEWTLAEVFDAPDAPTIARSELSEIAADSWAGLVFRFHPSLRRLPLEWNAPAVWRAISNHTEPPPPERAQVPVQWLLWRQDFKNYFRSTDAIELAALDAALRGAPFAEICEAMTPWLPVEEIPLRAATLIGTWADGGIISAAE